MNKYTTARNLSRGSRSNHGEAVVRRTVFQQACSVCGPQPPRGAQGAQSRTAPLCPRPLLEGRNAAGDCRQQQSCPSESARSLVACVPVKVFLRGEARVRQSMTWVRRAERLRSQVPYGACDDAGCANGAAVFGAAAGGRSPECWLVQRCTAQRAWGGAARVGRCYVDAVRRGQAGACLPPPVPRAGKSTGC